MTKAKTALQSWARIGYNNAQMFGRAAMSEENFLHEYDAQYEGVHPLVELPSFHRAYFWYRVGFRRYYRTTPFAHRDILAFERFGFYKPDPSSFTPPVTNIS